LGLIYIRLHNSRRKKSEDNATQKDKLDVQEEYTLVKHTGQKGPEKEHTGSSNSLWYSRGGRVTM